VKAFNIVMQNGDSIGTIRADRHEQAQEKPGWEAFFTDDGETFLLISLGHVREIKEIPIVVAPRISGFQFGV
jgi:hypothetical protein